MAGGGGESPKSNSPNPTKRVESETMIVCEGCNEKLHVAYRSLHNCNLDAKNLEAKVAETQPVEENKSTRPSPTAFYIFMHDFRKTYEEENQYVNLKDVPKLGGEKWKSYTEEEKKVYRDYADHMERFNQSLGCDDSDEDICFIEEYETRKLMIYEARHGRQRPGGS